MWGKVGVVGKAKLFYAEFLREIFGPSFVPGIPVWRLRLQFARNEAAEIAEDFKRARRSACYYGISVREAYEHERKHK